MSNAFDSMRPVHRRFQFRLSTLVLLIVLCALVFGWWRDHQSLTFKYEQLRRDYSQAVTDAEIDKQMLRLQVQACESQIERLSANGPPKR